MMLKKYSFLSLSGFLLIGAVFFLFVLNTAFLSLETTSVVAFAGIVVAMISVLMLEPENMLKVYFVFLLFDGMLKIVSNYHPIVHVASDLLLIAVLLRCFQRPVLLTDHHMIYKTNLIFSALLLFWLWVGVQFLNPWGLGLLPSLSSLKMYVVPMLIFFVVTFFMRSRDIEKAIFFIVILALIEGLLSYFEWTSDGNFLISLHPRYKATFIDTFPGQLYRPFGTTAMPGAASVWMFHGTMAALVALTIVTQNIRDISKKARWFWGIVATTFIPIAIGVAIICQVRSLVLRTVLLVLAGLLIFSMRQKRLLPLFVMAFLSLLAAFVIFDVNLFPASSSSNAAEPMTASSKNEAVLNRLSSLTNRSVWENSRSGGFEKIEQLSEYTILGIGLARTGAAAGQWKDVINEQTHFGLNWSFTDSLYRSLFTEIGFGGLISYLVMIGVCIWLLYSSPGPFASLTAAYVAVMLIAGFGSEGVLYQPDASLFWFFIGAAIRYKPGESQFLDKEVQL